MVLRSEFPDVPPVDLPIHDAVLARAAKEFGDRTALIDGVSGESVGYAELDHAARRIAAELAAAGVRKGEVVALHSPNSVRYPMAFYGVTRTGAAVTTVHPLATAEEFAGQLRDAAAAWIVTVSPLLGVARQAAEHAGGVREIFVCDEAGEAGAHRSLRDMLAGTAPEPVVEIDPAEDVAVLPYSSGTTGSPKAFVVRGPGARISEDELIAYVAGQVAPYKKVRRVEFTDTVPRSAAGKILRRELRAGERSSTTP